MVRVRVSISISISTSISIRVRVSISISIRVRVRVYCLVHARFDILYLVTQYFLIWKIDILFLVTHYFLIWKIDGDVLIKILKNLSTLYKHKIGRTCSFFRNLGKTNPNPNPDTLNFTLNLVAEPHS